MLEYQVTVSVNGIFLFRTEWSSDQERTNTAANLFATRLGINAKVSVTSRDASIEEVEFRMK